MKDTTRIVLYQKALKHLHKALLPGQIWAFSGAMEAAGIVRIDEYLAKKDCLSTGAYFPRCFCI